MIIKEVKLYKTPLDPTYKDIFDFHFNDIYHKLSTRKMFYDEYIKAFNIFESITLNVVNKAIKREDDTSFIVVNNNYDEVRDYNYCIIKDENDLYYFFFIINIMSLNDNPSNPSSQLVLNRDVWANNYYNIITYNILGDIECKHYDRYELNSEGKMLYNIYDIDGVECEHTISLPQFVNRYKVLFLCVELNVSDKEGFDGLNENVKVIFNINGSENISSGISPLNTRSYNPTLYFPIKCLDVNTNEFTPFNFISSKYICSMLNLGKEDGTLYSITLNPYEGYIDGHNQLTFSLFNSDISSYISRAYLTYNSPVKYSINIDYDDVITPGYEINFDCPMGLMILEHSQIQYNRLPVIALPATYIDDNKTLTLTGARKVNENGETININDRYEYESEENININELLGFNENNIINGLKSDTYNTLCEMQMYNYPIKYLCMVYNNEDKIIRRLTPKSNEILILYDKRTNQTRFSIKDVYTDKEIIAPTGIFLQNNGLLSYSIAAKDDYLIRNGSQERIALEMKAMNTGVNTGSSILDVGMGILRPLSESSLSQTINGIKNLSQGIADTINLERPYKAKINDLSRTPSKTSPSSGENDLIFQDRLLFVINEIPSDTPIYNKITGFYRDYGYEYRSYNNIFENNRKYFDYIRTSTNECYRLPINNNDKVTLEKIFNRGVTKWHILEDNSHLFNCSKTNLNNIEYKFVYDYSYKSWLTNSYIKEEE